MRSSSAFFALLVGLALLAMPRPSRADEGRFAIVAGNNRGADRQRSLRFAEDDAERFARLLSDLGFPPERIILLRGASPDDLRAAFRRAIAAIREIQAAGGRTLLLLYYSGHADGVNLEMGRERLAFSEFRTLLEEAPAEVKLAFIDSCQSGALTAAKGGSPAPEFDLSLAESIQVNGTAILTSSAAGENSQESAELRGSFFTSALLAGLRGAADADEDRRVTLAEIYQYAYDKTVERTARTLAGPQHPSYEYQIAGRGAVVLADLSAALPALVFGPECAGEFLLTRADTGEVMAEFVKPFGSRRRLSLPPGSYRVSLRRQGWSLGGAWTLPAAGDTVFRLEGLEGAELVRASLKEGAAARGPVGVFLRYGLQNGALANVAAVHEAALGARLDLGPLSLFPAFSVAQASVEERPLRYRLRLLTAAACLAWRLEYNVLDLFAGVQLALSYGSQTMPDGRTFEGAVFGYGGALGLDVPLLAGLGLVVFWEVGGGLFVLDGQTKQRLNLKGSIGLGYQF